MGSIYSPSRDVTQIYFRDERALAKGIGILLGCGHKHHFAVMRDDGCVLELSDMAQQCVFEKWQEVTGEEPDD